MNAYAKNHSQYTEGIYMVFDILGLRYIGKSENIDNRLREHAAENIVNYKKKYMPIMSVHRYKFKNTNVLINVPVRDYLGYIEEILIQILKPRLNTIHKKLDVPEYKIKKVIKSIYISLSDDLMLRELVINDENIPCKTTAGNPISCINKKNK